MARALAAAVKKALMNAEGKRAFRKPIPNLRLPEHGIFWRSRDRVLRTPEVTRLRRFFASYARRNLRAFPWRDSRTTPFQLLIAELLLAQTKAEDVSTVWPKLLSVYSSRGLLARARAPSLRFALMCLRFQNQRAKALKPVSTFIERQCAGIVPSTMASL